MAKASKWVYETVADAIGDRVTYPEHESTLASLRVLTSKLATQFAADNPCFDADKFVKECGF